MVVSGGCDFCTHVPQSSTLKTCGADADDRAGTEVGLAERARRSWFIRHLKIKKEGECREGLYDGWLAGENENSTTGADGNGRRWYDELDINITDEMKGKVAEYTTRRSCRTLRYLDGRTEIVRPICSKAPQRADGQRSVDLELQSMSRIVRHQLQLLYSSKFSFMSSAALMNLNQSIWSSCNGSELLLLEICAARASVTCWPLTSSPE